MVELLAPAGDRDSFLAALAAGADAVYIGAQSFSARDGATNFPFDELKSLTFRAHVLGVRVYLAANTLVKDSEVGAYLDAVRRAAECGVDAVIVQDIYLAEAVRTASGLPIHLSTQAGVNNVWGARVAKEKGIARVILARETGIKEIAQIASEIETEVFVQGALCSSFSGQCLMSSWAGCNSANRGRCKQPCRKRYRLDGDEGYLISLSDLSVGEKIADLLAAGVSSFKIEGRMRSPAYVYAAVKYYRDLLDGRQADFESLRRAYNRGDYTAGYAFGTPENLRATRVAGHIGAPVGYVMRLDNKGCFVKSAYTPVRGDGFKILRRGEEVGGTTSFTLATGGFYLQGRFAVGDEVRLTSHPSEWNERLLPVSAEGRLVAGEALSLTLYAAGEKVSVTGAVAESARTEPISQERWAQAVRKVGELPFVLTSARLVAGGGFVPMGQLNELRRNAFQALAECLAARTHAPSPSQNSTNSVAVATNNDKISISPTFYNTLLLTETGAGEADVKVVAPADYRDRAAVVRAAEKRGNRLTLLRIPTFFSRVDEALFEALLPHFDGVYAEGLGAIGYAKAKGLGWFAGLGLNAFCSAAVAGLYADGASGVVLSGELSEREVKAIRATFPAAFVAVEGGVKLMDFLYCPYGGDCANCRGRDFARLTDEGSRAFFLRRVRLDSCRFELYNGSALSIPCPPPRATFDVGLPQGGVPTNAGHWRRPLPNWDEKDNATPARPRR